MNERKSIDPIYPGPPCWVSMHLFTLGMSEIPTQEERDAFTNYLNVLKVLFPCINCREHLKSNLAKFPLDEKRMKTRMDYFRYTVDLHNVVNKMLGKKEIDYQFALSKYSQLIIETKCKIPGAVDHGESTCDKKVFPKPRCDFLNPTTGLDSNENVIYGLIAAIIVLFIFSSVIGVLYFFPKISSSFSQVLKPSSGSRVKF